MEISLPEDTDNPNLYPQVTILKTFMGKDFQPF